jgi:hypothetical protein
MISFDDEGSGLYIRHEEEGWQQRSHTHVDGVGRWIWIGCTRYS